MSKKKVTTEQVDTTVVTSNPSAEVETVETKETPKVPTKEEIVSAMNEFHHTGTLTELRKMVAEKLGSKENTIKRLSTELGIQPVKDEETGVWSVPQKRQSVKLNSEGVVKEALKIVEMFDTNGLTFPEIAAKLKRHPGQVGRQYHFGTLLNKYPKIQTAVELGKISTSLVYEVQRSTKELTEQNNIIGYLIKNMAGEKVKRSDYTILKGGVKVKVNGKTEKEVVAAETAQKLSIIGHVK